MQAGWAKRIHEKTIAGTSAGANVLAQHYAALDKPEVEMGLGLLPVKVIVHYRSDYNAPHIDWDKSYEQLEATGGNLRILALQEGYFEIIER